MISRRPSTTTVNIFANLFSKFWIAGANIVFLPIYINVLGVDSYGLLGFYTTLVGSMTLLDFGLSMTLNRELARSRALKDLPTETRNMVFTVEVIYLIIGLIIGIIVFAFSDIIAHKWISSERLSSATVANSIKLMGIVFSLQWPISLYSGGLFGLERQVLCGTLDVLFATLRMVGAVLVLMFYKNTIETFFIWQALVNLLHLGSLRLFLWRSLPYHKDKARFSIAAIQKIKQFSIGVTAISVVSFALSYADKIIVSKMVTLEIFAFYAFASSVGGGLGQFGGAITSAIFPQFSALSSDSTNEMLIGLYHRSCRLMASLVFPIAVTAIFYTPEILTAWTHNTRLVTNTVVLTRILIAGTALNCLMHMPYYLMLAKGITKFTIVQNAIATVIVIPLLILLIGKFGTVGASCVWLLVNLCYVLISLPLIHRIVIPGETVKWYVRDSLFPLLVSVSAVGLPKLLLINFPTRITTNLLFEITVATIFCFVSIFFSIPKRQLKRLVAGG